MPCKNYAHLQLKLLSKVSLVATISTPNNYLYASDRVLYKIPKENTIKKFCYETDWIFLQILYMSNSCSMI